MGNKSNIQQTITLKPYIALRHQVLMFLLSVRNSLARQNELFAVTLLFFFCFASVVMVLINIPNHDTLYYWDWSRHLALSYYDGPPLVAYIIHSYVWLFGNSELALNFLAIFSNFTIAASIFLLAKTLYNLNVACFSALIWLLSPIVFIQYANSFTYDTPLTLFWVLTLYFFYQGKKTDRCIYLYLAGTSAGLMMLSKYTGVLLFLALIILCIMVKSYRNLLKNPHLYLSGLFSLLLFSPVLYWNLSNGFSSFRFQFNHGFNHIINFTGPLKYFGLLLICYNVILILFIYCTAKNKILFFNEKSVILFYPAIVTLIFFLAVSFSLVKYNWQQTFYPEVVILIAYAATQWDMLMRIAKYTLIFYAVVIVVIIGGELVNNKFIFSKNIVDTGSTTKKTILELNTLLSTKDPLFVRNFRLGASLVYFLQNHPFVYSVESRANQYNYWSKTITKEIKNGQVQRAFYVNTHPLAGEMSKLFADCKEIYKTSKQKFDSNQLYLYQCESPVTSQQEGLAP